MILHQNILMNNMGYKKFKHYFRFSIDHSSPIEVLENFQYSEGDWHLIHQ